MNKTWTPPELLQMSSGYWTACTLHAAVKLDVFSPLAARPCSAAVLAKRLKTTTRGLAMLLNALTAMGLLKKTRESYAATSFAARFLDRSAPGYLGHIILHHHHLVDGWAHLDEAVRRKDGGTFRKRVSHTDDEEIRESFLLGMLNLGMQLAPRIVPQIDLKGRRRLLDLGGGPGTYAIHFCLHNPGLTAMVYDLPTTRRFAEGTIARFGLTERVAFADGDFIRKGIAGRYDVAWLSHILHGENPAGCKVLLRKAVKALEPGGIILVQEFVLDDTLDRPLFPALFSLNMLLGTSGGQAYSQGQITSMLADAGAAKIRRLPLDLPNGAGIIAARAGTP
ncbi:MAG: SAM-dependent methyltransferase [Lentisphaerae bacterium RIFOXYB12_FULL_65_16]|nr:MAG: SAM-dependent methyltransferase [Lentisphaerae bacterium RIFOXYA12_64_32]OGV85912.1 MAG: SAM-dependent methyltransferase [Lentisphaerae bacterium RIFOXYB12_FULL_65_16]